MQSLVVLNASQAGCAALVLTSTGVQHIPFLDLSFTQVTTLVRLIRRAVARGAGDPLVHQSTCAHVEGLVQQMPFLSDSLRSLG